MDLARSFYINYLAKVKPALIEKFSLMRLLTDDKDTDIFSDEAFLLGEELDSDWRYLCHLARLKDYVEEVDITKFKDSVAYWVTPKEHTWFGDSVEFDKRFYDAVHKVVAKNFKTVEPQFTVDEYINNRAIWGVGGAVLAEERANLYEVIDGKPVKVKHSKWTFAWTVNNSTIKHGMLRKRKQFAKAFVKKEVRKSRAVISSDIWTYLKMDYISKTMLDEYFKGDERSTLWMTQDQRMQMWEKLTHFTNGWRMPVDQGEFDQQQKRSMVLAVIKALKYYMLLSATRYHDDITKVFDLILYALDGGTISVDGSIYEYLNGVLSGWKWTALIDTIISLTIAQLSIDMCSEAGRTPQLYHLYVQGDDCDYSLGSKEDCIAVMAAYRAMGWIVHPKKSYISKTRDEFLRRAMTPGHVDGYPARSPTSILWSNPVKTIVPFGFSSATEVCDKWHRFGNRLGVQLIDEAAIDISRSLKLNIGDTRRWLHTPSSVGGAGYKPYSHSWLSLPDAEITRGDIISTPAIEQFSSLGDHDLAKTFVTNTVVPIKLRHDTTQFKEVTGRWSTNVYTRSILIPKIEMSSFDVKLKPIRTLEQNLEATKNRPMIDWVFRRLTKNMMNEFMQKGIVAVAPRATGLSVEYMSWKWSTRRENIYARILANNGTMNDYKKARLAEEMYWRATNIYAISE